MKTPKKNKIIIVICGLFVLMIAADWILGIILYDEYFNSRFESYEPLMLYVDDFEGLECEKCEFISNKEQKLAGYLYSFGSDQRGTVVMAHGFGGGGQNSYMDCANCFARHGYYVFSFDVTGNDNSEGEKVGGLPQGVIDLSYAISFVEQHDKLKDLPIVLFGHSWGAYCASSVLRYHPEIKAVAAVSGFNQSTDLIEAQGKTMVGNAVFLMLPFVILHEKIQFGSYASNTSLDGFSLSKAAVMIIHSEDDDIVPAEYGYDRYYKEYKNDPRFEFVRYKDRGHNNIYYNSDYIDEFYATFRNWAMNLDYDHEAEKNKERFEKNKAEYIYKHLDRDKWCNKLDDDLFNNIVRFYDENTSQ